MILAFTGGTGITGAIIRWHTWSWAAHVAFVLPDGQYLDATPSAGVSVHPHLAGSHPRPLNPSPRFFETIDCPKAIENSIFAWAHDQVGKHYDWSAIYGMAFHRDWEAENEWFCSELVTAGFAKKGWPLLRTNHLNRVTPAEDLLSPRIREVRFPW